MIVTDTDILSFISRSYFLLHVRSQSVYVLKIWFDVCHKVVANAFVLRIAISN